MCNAQHVETLFFIYSYRFNMFAASEDPPQLEATTSSSQPLPLESAVSSLYSKDENKTIQALQYIQHLTYQNSENKIKVSFFMSFYFLNDKQQSKIVSIFVGRFDI